MTTYIGFGFAKRKSIVLYYKHIYIYYVNDTVRWLVVYRNISPYYVIFEISWY